MRVFQSSSETNGRRDRLNKSVGAYFQVVGALAYTGGQWVFAIALTKYLSVEAFGFFSYTAAILTPVFIFFEGNLRNIISSDVQIDRSDTEYLHFKMFQILIAVSCALLVVYVMPDLSLPLASAVIVIKSVESISTATYGIAQRSGKHSRIAVSLFLRATAYSLAIFPALYYDTLLPCVVVTASLLLISLLLADLKSLKSEISIPRLRWNSSEKPAILARKTAIFGLISVLTSLRITLPVYYIEHNLSIYHVGIYSAFYYIVVASSRPVTTLFAARLTIFAQEIVRRNIVGSTKILLESFLLSAACASLIYVISSVEDGFVVKSLYTSDHSQNIETLKIMLIASVPFYTGVVIVQSLVAIDAIFIQFLHSLSSVAVLSALLVLFRPDSIYEVSWLIAFESAFFLLSAMLAYAYCVYRNVAASKN